MSNSIVLLINLIVSNPNISSGRPVIEGTGIRVQDIAAAHLDKQRTPLEVAEDYDITLGQVHAALAYYFEHQAEIDQQMQRDEAAILEAKEQGLGQRHSPLLR